jgi:hypothetical protein
MEAIALGKTLSSLITKNPYEKAIPSLNLNKNPEKSEAELEPLILEPPELEDIPEAIPLPEKFTEKELIYEIIKADSEDYKTNHASKLLEYLDLQIARTSMQIKLHQGVSSYKKKQYVSMKNDYLSILRKNPYVRLLEETRPFGVIGKENSNLMYEEKIAVLRSFEERKRFATK